LEIESGLETDFESVDLAKFVPNGKEPLPVTGDARLLERAVDILGSESHRVSVTAANGVATVVAGQAPRKQLELYVARLIAEAHGGELRESSTGLAMTLPLS